MADTENGIAACLQTILDDAALAADLRSRARRRALAEFSWDHVASEYEAWLRSLIRR